MASRGRRRGGGSEPWQWRRYDPDTKADVTRAGPAEFAPSFRALKDAVELACSQYGEWDGRVAAGIAAALNFTAVCPEMVHALIVQGRREKTENGNQEREVLGYFADRLEEVVPGKNGLPYSTHRGAVEAIAAVIRGHLQAGTEADLARAVPDLLYLTLMPHIGVARARSWANWLGVPLGKI